MTSKIKVNYKMSLPSYLDEKNIKWKAINDNEIILILIHPENFDLNNYLFELGIHFEEWRQKIEQSN